LSESENEAKQVKLSVYVDEDVRAKFKAACAIQKISMNQVVNQLLEGWISENDPTQQHGSDGSGKRTNRRQTAKGQ